MSTYNPASIDDRKTLARELTGRLERGGFRRIFARGEAVYEKPSSVDPRLRARVYTSCDRDGARAEGEDAIRVALVYTGSDKPRGLVSLPAVHRVGDVDAIIGRVVERIDGLRSKLCPGENCRCGAPLFVAKTGRHVCADFCFAKK